MPKKFCYRPENAVIALQCKDDFVWDCSVIRGDDGLYHMFSSRWPKEMGFGWNWLFNSEVIHSVSVRPEGPYCFKNVALPRRDAKFFDGMNTHNTCIRKYKNKYYLYYMGSTYTEKPPKNATDINEDQALTVWNRKRIGVAVADDLNGTFIRQDEPILNPRDVTYWDCTVTTNPAVCIMDDGTTYLIYKSRSGNGATLKLGVAKADRPDGKFVRICDDPILTFDDPDLHVEDPYLWYDKKRKKFCLIAKDDSKNNSYGITGEWGNGFYAESEDCIRFEIAESPLVYSRVCQWADGHTSKQINLERPSLLFNMEGEPTHLYCASGDGPVPYSFERTYIVCMPLVKEN